ncbi:MAG: polysaccharide biosynthesis tyrosine autokinase [Pirellulales bacterium]
MQMDLKRDRVEAENPLPPATNVTPANVLIALRRWWKVALPIGSILALSGAAFVYLTFRPVYVGQVWLRVYHDPRYIAFQQQTENVESFVSNQMEAIRSPWVIDGTLSHPEIARLPEIAQAQDQREHLKSNIAVRPVGRSEFLTMEYRSGDPQNAALIVNTIAEEYLKFYNGEGRAEEEELIKLLKERRDFHQKEVARLKENVSTLAKIAGVPDPQAPADRINDKNDSPVLQSMLILRKQLTEVIVEREVLQAQLQVLEQQVAKSEASVPEVMVEQAMAKMPELQEPLLQLASLRAQLAEIETTVTKGKASEIYTQRAADAKKLEEEIEQKRATLRGVTRERLEESALRDQAETLIRLRKQLENQKVMEVALQKRIDTVVAENNQVVGNTMELEFARDELTQTLDVYNRIKMRIEQKETERMAPDRVERQKEAIPPHAPLEKHPFKKMGILAFGLFSFPFALCVAWELFRRRINDREELEKASGLSVIGEIPDFTSVSRSRQARKQLEPYEESINSLRTQLILTRETPRRQVISLASAVSGEGKTSVAAKLAVSIARSTKQPTLLVDADIRRPNIHRLFDIPYQPGLGDVLAEKADLFQAIVHDDHTGLDVLPAGVLHFNPHQLMSSAAISKLLDQLRGRYEHIVVDTTPILQASESLNVHAVTDGCIICTMRDVTRVDRFLLAYRRLQAAGAKPIGVVLNGVSWMQYTASYGGYEYYAEAAANAPE